jgi:hypothetical protein
MAELTVGAHEQAAATVENKTATPPYSPPYPPSWADRLTAWVERLPGPAWLYYLGAALVLVLTRTIAAWSDGSLPVGTFSLDHALMASAGVWLLFVLISYVDDRAAAALTTLRPVLLVEAAEYESLRYQLTTMPARPALVAPLVGLLLVGLAFNPTTSTVLDFVISGFDTAIAALVVYHTVRQLRLISRIYTQHTRISILETSSLYALSRVTAITAITLFLLTSSFLILAVNWQQDQFQNAMVGVLFYLLALGTFVWPLLGAHQLLQEEKTRRKSEVARRLEAVTAEMHHRVDTRELQGMDALKDALDGLVVEQSVLDKASTWPWEPETVRAVATALLLPVALWIITRVLERLGF